MTTTAGPMDLSFKVNGTKLTITVEPRETLLGVLRDRLDLTGAKRGCDEAVCGACSVLFNGVSICSCTMLALEAHESEITTIEGLSGGNERGAEERFFHPLQRAFVMNDAQQCGFCTPGQIVSAKSFLDHLDSPRLVDEQQIREGLSGNICRCGCYNNIVKAVQQVMKDFDVRSKRGD
jgi:xanthine dehydrogenase YagT iron-sulfur-binding subunit